MLKMVISKAKYYAYFTAVLIVVAALSNNSWYIDSELFSYYLLNFDWLVMAAWDCFGAAMTCMVLEYVVRTIARQITSDVKDIRLNLWAKKFERIEG